ncbi:MAG: RNA polymerase sigma factor [Mariniphaga sp.]|nr:RNA polymerase sigma factor [Mariniphaga sp.]
MENKEKYFTGIFNANKDRVYRICCSYVRSIQNRKDLYQEIFMKIWENLSSFRKESHINTWIYRISINTAINYCKLQSKTENRCIEIRNDLFNEPESGTFKKLETEQELEKMFEAINSLPVLEKTIVSLELEGLEQAAIAEICGISEVNVRVKFHRIKKKIQKLMEENNNEF